MEILTTYSSSNQPSTRGTEISSRMRKTLPHSDRLQSEHLPNNLRIKITLTRRYRWPENWRRVADESFQSLYQLRADLKLVEPEIPISAVGRVSRPVLTRNSSLHQDGTRLRSYSYGAGANARRYAASPPTTGKVIDVESRSTVSSVPGVGHSVKSRSLEKIMSPICSPF